MKKIGGKLKAFFCLKRGIAFIGPPDWIIGVSTSAKLAQLFRNLELNPGLARKTGVLPE